MDAKLTRALRRRGYEDPRRLYGETYVCRHPGGSTRIVAKRCRDLDECVVARQVDELAECHNPGFAVAELPRTLEVLEEVPALVMPCYEGRPLRDPWTSGKLWGGHRIDPALAPAVAEALHDLCDIDARGVARELEDRGVENLVYDDELTSDRTLAYLETMAARELLSADEVERAAGIVSRGFDGKDDDAVFNNGDFYPRNFIELPAGKLLILDWDPWTEDYRANLVDRLVNVVAFACIHMWGNLPWQLAFVSAVSGWADLRVADLQRAVLMKALAQHRHFGATDYAHSQLPLVRLALDGERFARIFGP